MVVAAASVAAALVAGPATATVTPSSPSPSTEPSSSASPSPSAAATKAADAGTAKKPVKAGTATVNGRAWDDRNRNGIQESGEPGLVNVTVFLAEWPDEPADAKARTRAHAARVTKSLKAGAKAANEDGLHQATTDARGRYTIAGVTPGAATMSVESVVSNPNGRGRFYRFSLENATQDESKDSDFHEESNGDEERPAVYGAIYDLRFVAGETRTLDAGMYFDEKWGAGTVTFTGRVWNDANRDGEQDPGERGVPGLPVFHVVSSDDDPDFYASTQRILARLQGRTPPIQDTVRVTTTDAAGEYVFTGLNPGDQYLAVGAGPVDGKGRITRPAWRFSPPMAVGDHTKDSDVIGETEADEIVAFTSVGSGFFMGPGDSQDVDAGVYKRGPNSPSASPTVTASPTASPAGPGEGGSLPNTGVQLGGMIAAALTLLGSGAALAIVARRRRQST